MDEITGALVGIGFIVSEVFVPMVFFGGSTGEMYRQFAVTTVSAMMLSVVIAIVFTPGALRHDAQAPFTLQWAGMSLEEKEAGSGAIYLYTLALAAVFLSLAALHESWAIPIAVILAMPVGIPGALVGAWLGGQSNGIYFQVGLQTVVGLTGKNGIMIVEFARDRMAKRGESATEAVRLRFRPILMTSLAFGMGVLPLVLSSGAGSGGAG